MFDANLWCALCGQGEPGVRGWVVGAAVIQTLGLCNAIGCGHVRVREGVVWSGRDQAVVVVARARIRPRTRTDPAPIYMASMMALKVALGRICFAVMAESVRK